MNEAKLRSPDCNWGEEARWSEPLIVRAHECARKGKTVFSDFGVLAQIWAVGPNLTTQSNRIFNVDNEKVFTLNLLGLL